MESRSALSTSLADRDEARIYQDLERCLSLVNIFSDIDVQEIISDKIWKACSSVLVHGAMPPLTIRETSAMSPAHLRKVCVVGAGVAGLRCADVLSRRGFNVTIIEARDRVGGRLHQDKLPSGQLVDMGPNWIHGTDNNPILDIAMKTNTEIHEFQDQENFFDEDGKVLHDGKELNITMWEIIEEAFAFSKENTDTIKPKATLHEWFRLRLQKKFPDDGEAHRRKILKQMIHFWGAFVASKVETQSLKFLWMEEVIGGQNLFCAETYQKILDYIAKPALDNCSIVFSTRVTKIDTSGNNIVVWTDNGQFMKFDEVVFTAPLGWLKKNAGKTFSPLLPRRVIQAIDNIGYGNLEKVYVTFPAAFWLGNKLNPGDDQFTGFFQWLAPRYARVQNWARWNQEAVDMSTLSGTHSHPTLLFYLFGDQVTALSDKLANVSPSGRSEYLIKYLKPYYSILPHYSETSPECMPTSALYTDWTADDLAGNGSYTTLRKGVEEADVDIEVLREGLPGRSLWFAGEHTAPFVAYGTVTGAYWSGELVAERIAKAYHSGDVEKVVSELAVNLVPDVV